MTGKIRSIALTAGVLFAVVLASSAGGQTPPQAPAAAVRPIPGITAKDAYPNGCVDCHVAAKDGDMRLSVLLAKWTAAAPAALVEKARAASADASKIKGKHLAIANVKANIPQTCLSACHKKGSVIAPPFAQLMHLIHLTGGAQNRFLTANQGECTYCHKLDQKTGLWKIANGAEK
jgi:hypothetical protein